MVDYELPLPAGLDRFGIGVIGAGFIVRDCHLPAYREAGFRVVGITSRTRAQACEVAEARGVARVYDSVDDLLADGDASVIDIAVPPQEQPALIRKVVAAGKHVRGILAQKPLAMTLAEAAELVRICREAGIALAVNQNMRHDHAVRATKSLLAAGVLGEPVLATIDMRAIPHWMPWSEGLRSLSTFIMSIHHLDCFRYWLGDPVRVMASTRPDPRTRFPHSDGINLYILEFAGGARASAWDDVWSGPVREGAGDDTRIEFRVEGTEGLAIGEIGWPRYPVRTPSTLRYSVRSGPGAGTWQQPRWDRAWFPDAFRGTMGELLLSLATGAASGPSGEDNLRTVALVEAVYRSACEHRMIDPAELLADVGVANGRMSK